MIDNYLHLSIEDIEKEEWRDLEEYPTNLVKRVHEIRKKRISDYDLDDYRIAISQNLGIGVLIPVVAKILEANILIETAYYPGDLLQVVLQKDDYWKDHLLEKEKVQSFLIRKKNEIMQSTQITDEIKTKLLSSVDQFISG